MSFINQLQFSWLGLLLVFVLGWLLTQNMGHMKQRLSRHPLIQERPNTMPLLISLTWLFYASISLLILFQSQTLLITILALFLSLTCFWFFWFVLRDFVAGLLFRWSHDFKPGHDIQINQHISGAITQLGWLGLYLNQEHTILRIPYHKIQETAISTDQTGSALQEVIRFSLQSKDSPENIKIRLHEILLLMPGISLHREPEIHCTQKTDTEFQIEILIHMLESRYSKPIESQIQYIMQQSVQEGSAER